MAAEISGLARRSVAASNFRQFRDAHLGRHEKVCGKINCVAVFYFIVFFVKCRLRHMLEELK